MGLFDRWFGKPQASANLEDLIRHGSDTGAGVVVNDEAAMRVAAAWRCVDIISGAIGSMPLDMIRREDESTRVPAVGHPLRQVLTVKPNDWQTPQEFKRLLQSHMLMRGNAYARKVMIGGKLLALIPLHPDRVEVKQKSDLTFEYKVSREGGAPLILGSKDVMHLRGMSLDGVTGMSVIRYMRETLGLAIQTQRAGSRLFTNGMLAGGEIRHPKKLSDAARDNLQRSLGDEYGGVANSGKWIITEEGMELKPLALSAEDSQWLGARDFQRYDIAMFYGVPPHMIGATEKTTSWGSGIEAQGIGFVTYTLSNWIKTWEETIKRDLIDPSEWDTLDARFFTAGLLRGDTKTRWETYVKGLQWGVLSPDEVRAFEDMNPRPDGDGGEYYEPPNASGNETPDMDGDNEGQSNELADFTGD